MKPGQVLTQWFQDLMAGRLRTPQAIFRAAHAERSLGEDRFFGAPAETDEWQAPERLKAPGHFSTYGWIAQGERADWQHCDLRLMRWSAMVVEEARKRGVPLFVHCAFRGEVEQTRVNHLGYSKAAYGRSAHNIGEAVDIIHSRYAWDMTRQEWDLIRVLGERALRKLNAPLAKADRLQLTWGGSFKSRYDPAHWEITDFRDRLRRLPEGHPVHMQPRRILEQIRL